MIKLGPDPMDQILDRYSEIKRTDALPAIDDQELAEREDAAARYFGEDEAYFVDFITASINESIEGYKDIRKVQNNCWNVYNENEPVSYADKEEWQARTVIPKPFQTVQFGVAAVRKAFSPDFLSIENTNNEAAAKFWQRLMSVQLDAQHSNFLLRFIDAVTMGLAVGVSLEMIPRWVPGKGLEYTLAEPWKIQRDPGSLARDPQSGLYWIHQEWLDFYLLKQGETAGRYFDVDRVKDVGEENSQDPFMTREAIAARRAQLIDQTKFRQLILTSEYWGSILDKHGALLLPRARTTIAGGRIIQYPTAVSTDGLRWPGISFSPLPDILKFGGRGLLEGTLSMWEAMNTVMCLHQDNLQWVVNPPREINVDGLVDPKDVESWPGKDYLTRDTLNGQQVVRTVDRRSRTNEVLANLQYIDQQFQRGSFVTDGVQGLPGYRKDITARESRQNLDQAMGVFGLMGINLESGAIASITAGADVIRQQISYRELQAIFTEQELSALNIQPDDTVPSGVANIPPMDGQFSVSGMQALMKDNETLQTIRELVIPLSGHPRYAAYIKPYRVIKAIEERVNLSDEGLFATEEEARSIELSERLTAAKQTEAAEALAELQEMLGITDLVTRIQGIETTDLKTIGERILLMKSEFEEVEENGDQRNPNEPVGSAPSRAPAGIPAGAAAFGPGAAPA